MKTTVVQKAIVLNDKQQMLMLRRSKTDVRRPLQWDLPGGMHEEGEELLASITREITEEINLAVTDLRPVYAKTKVRTWKEDTLERVENVVYIFYVAQAASTDVRLSFEHDKFQWEVAAVAEQAYEYDTHKELLRHVISNHLI